jgi:hypothetical protein
MNSGVKLIYINRNKGWREITTEVFTDAKGLASLIKKVEVAEKFVKSCKFCKAKKFKAKTGNTVCANACWTTWAGKKKTASTKKKSSQKVAAKSSRKSRAMKMTQSAAKKAARNPQRQHHNAPPPTFQKGRDEKKGQKKRMKYLQRFSQEILPGDLVTIEEYEEGKVTTDYTGTVLGIVQKVENRAVTTVWTANTAQVPVWLLPLTNEYEANALKGYRFKVLSRKVEWVKVA